MIKKIYRKLKHWIKEYHKPKITAKIFITEASGLLKGKNIIITGGTKGIGLAMAQKFHAEGADVIITGRDECSAKRIADQIGCKSLVLDISNLASFDAFVHDAKSLLGSIDCLVNNAGISLHEQTFFDVTAQTFEQQFLTNLEGPFFLTQAIAKEMIESNTKGNILFISSETGLTPDIRPYGLTKVALNSLSQGLAYLFINNNIRVNTICPGVVATPLTGYSPEEDLSFDFNSIGRLYLPYEIAEVAAFLIADSSLSLSGQIIACNNARTVNARWRK